MSRLEDDALAVELAGAAGALLLSVREEAFAEGAPVGRLLGELGDRRANELILERLRLDRPVDSVLSEESADDRSRVDADRVWIIDPLDGSREFGLAGRSDWAVHVALWERGKEVTAAAVALPALGTVVGTQDRQASSAVHSPPRVLVSDSRPPAFLTQLCARLGMAAVPMGSAGAKAMGVVRGDADAYVHAGGQWEWDSAAPVGVALAHGLHASRLDGSRLRYNQANPYLPDLLICRPELADQMLTTIAAVQGQGRPGGSASDEHTRR
jgi:3'(2'), 5'-bisphosphate nucleotidase